MSNMDASANISKIVNKVISFPLSDWKENDSDYYKQEDCKVFEAKYLGRTLSVIRAEGKMSLWYDGEMITCSSNEINNLFASLHTFQVSQKEEKRLKRIEELAKLF